MNSGYLNGSLRTVRVTSLLLSSGIKSFSIERGGRNFKIESKTLLSKIFSKREQDTDLLLKIILPNLADENLADSIRLSLISAFDQNPNCTRIVVDASKMSWKVHS